MTRETLIDLEVQLAQLRRVRVQGTRAVEFSGGNGVSRRVEFRSDAELASAIYDLERRIAKLNNTRISQVRIQSSKGV
jgi:hypothetical protein